MRCLYIFEINPLPGTSFANILSYSKSCIFVLFMVSFAVASLVAQIVKNLSAIQETQVQSLG